MDLAHSVDAEMLWWGAGDMEDPQEWVDVVQCEHDQQLTQE